MKILLLLAAVVTAVGLSVGLTTDYSSYEDKLRAEVGNGGDPVTSSGPVVSSRSGRNPAAMFLSFGFDYDPDGKLISTRAYRYKITTKPTGWRIRVQINRSRTERVIIARSPYTGRINCVGQCPIQITAQAWPVDYWDSPYHGKITLRVWELKS